MARKQQHRDSNARPDEHGTEVVQERLGDTRHDREPTPKMPHERDETTGTGSTSAVANEESKDVLHQARKDMESDRQDTDRGPVMDKTYRKLKR